MRLGFVAVLFVCFYGFGGYVKAAAPSNDNFANAVLINGASNTVTGSNIDATKESGEPNHAGNVGGKSVWWRWIAPTSGRMAISTVGSSFDTILGVYTGTQVSALTTIAADDDSGGNFASRAVFDAIPGTTYRIAVDGYSGSAGTITVHINPLVAPPNDNFTNSSIITGLTNTVSGSNVDASKEPGEPNHAGNSGGKSVWWTWIAPSSGRMAISTLGSSFNTILGVYTGNQASALTTIAADDDSGGNFASRAVFDAIPGTAYRIAVDGYFGSAGTITLQLSLAVAPPNDNFTNSSIITGLTNTVSGSNVDATQEPGEANYAGESAAGKSVWWTWIPPSNRSVTLDASGSSFAPILLAVYMGSNISNLTLVARGGPRLSFGAVAGTAYRIVVDGRIGYVASGTILLNLTSFTPPSNDFFADHAVIVGLSNTVTGSNVNASEELGEPYHGGGGETSRSVWWSWMAQSDGVVTMDTLGSSFRAALAVYTGNALSSLTQVANDSTSSGGNLAFAAVAGTTYYVAVDGWLGESGSIVLNVNSFAGSENDLFANRLVINGVNTTVRSFNVDATKEPGEPNHTGNAGGRSVWWTWTPPTDLTVTLDTIGSSGFSTLLAVYTGNNVSNLTLIADDVGGGPNPWSLLTFPALAGTPYQIAVDGSGGSSGLIALNLRSVIPPANDVFAKPAVIPGLMYSTSVQNSNATVELGEPTHGSYNGGHSLWWLFTAPTNLTVMVDTFGSTFTTMLAVYTGDVLTNLTVVTTNIGYVISNHVRFGALAGKSYRIAVDGVVGSSGTAAFNFRAITGPINDWFDRRSRLDGMTIGTTGSNVNASKELGEPKHADNGGGASVWWTWTAPTNGAVNLDTSGSSFDTLLAVYTGDFLSNLVEVASDDEGGDNHASKLTFYGHAGTHYQIAVDGWTLASSSQFGSDPLNPSTGTIALNVRQTPMAEPPDIKFVGSWPGFRGGRALDVKVVGTLAYVAIAEGGLLILDVANPLEPRKVGVYDTLGETRRVTVVDGYTYLADGPGGFQIVDVHNPAIPAPVGGSRAVADANAIAVKNNFALVADGSLGLRIFDISSRLSPVLVAAIPGFATNITVSGNYAFVCEGTNGLRIVDITSPTSPITKSVYKPDYIYAIAVAVDGPYAYVCNSGQLDVISIVDLAFPTLVGKSQARPNWHTGVTVEDNKAYVSVQYSDFYGSGGLYVFDVRDPTDPENIIAQYRNLGGTRESGVAIANGFAYLANGIGLSIFDLRKSASADFYTGSTVYNIAVQGNYAYLANGMSGLHVIDIGNPSLPVRAGVASKPAFTVAPVGAYLFVNNMELIDAGNPGAPTYLIEKTYPSSFSLGTFASGNRAAVLLAYRFENCNPECDFLMYSPNFINFYDISDRQNPIDISDGYFRGARDFAIWNDYGYSGSGSGSGLLAWDLSTNVTGGVEGYGGPIDAADNLVAFGFDLFDISDPRHPVSRGSFGPPVTTMNSISDLKLDRGIVVAVETNSGLHVIDVRTPGNFSELGGYPGVGFQKVALAGNYAIIGHGEQGLTILDLGDQFASAPVLTVQPRTVRVLQGGNARLDVGASGTVPLAYQWRFRGTNIAGATNFVLSLSNVGLDDDGQYSVVVSNSVGLTISTNAHLSVDVPPTIAITNPEPNQIFLAPAAIDISAQASDGDGTVTNVSFYIGSTLLASVTNPPYSISTPSLSVGTYVLSATAMDNEGATTASEPVTITVTNVRVFQFSQPQYEVHESNTFATVTIFRNSGGIASVNYNTLDGSARSVGDGRIGQYHAASGTLSFGVSELFKTIPIQIVDDRVDRGSRDFLVRLSAPSVGWFLASPTNAVVTIIDNDPSSTNVFTDVVSPTNAPAGRGSLQITLQPPEALGHWRFWWETAWRDSGTIASNLVPGDYRVQFMSRSGYSAPAESNYTVIVGVQLSTTNFYVSGLPGRLGAIGFTLRPEQVITGLNGQWRLEGHSNTNWQNSGGVLTDLIEGAYLAEFKAVGGGYQPPAPHMIEVLGGETLRYVAEYLTPETRQGAVPQPLDSFFTLTNPLAPYQFNGQIITEAGYGSGFVVRPRTVLTAAHVAFDSARLTYADTVLWFFQRHRGEYDPPPLEPRGWYLFGGYAASRTNDFEQGLSPGESSIESRNLDVAALYFFTNAARGGYGGYLTSTAENDWLNNSAFKLLLGYPVDHVPEKDRGRLHQSGPMFSPLERITNEVFRTDQIFGSGGNSGGPLCVFSVDSLGRPFFIPAGVYLGDDNQTYVRAIDIDVVDLINRAEASGNGGGNSTAGGVSTVSLSLGGTDCTLHPGGLEILLRPPAAVRLGGKWRISPTNYGECGELITYTQYISNATYTLPVRSQRFDIQVTNLPGFTLPSLPRLTNIPASTSLKTPLQLSLEYSVLPPRLFFDRQRGLGMTGTAQTVYRIQSSPSLAEPVAWANQGSITLAPGTNWLPGILPVATSNRFYRLLWVSD